MTSSLLISPHYKLRLKPRPNLTPSIKKFGPFHFCTPLSRRPDTVISYSFKPEPHTLPLQSLKPYILSQSKPILLGWLCSAVSAFSLSQLVPRIGQFSSNLAHIELIALRNEGLLLGALLAAKMVASYLQQAFLWEAALTAVFNLRVDVFGKVLERDLGFFEGGNAVSSGDAAYRITAEASDVSCTLYCLLSTIVPSALQLSAMAMQMFSISPALSLISSVVIPCMALIVAHLGERLRRISKKAHLSIAALSAYLNEGIGKAYNELKQGEPAIERLCELSKFRPEVRDKPDAIPLDHVAGDVRFTDVSFKYRGNTPIVLDRLNLHVRAGETIALVGPSGGGKTTLAKLLLRLYDPLSGCISVDNHDIQHIQLDSLRRHVCLVSQDITLFSGTVAENIGYRDLMTHIDMDKVELAGQLANAEEFIRMLPAGYETNIGARGSILSGGQKQRLAIARAIYQDPSVLILDEATSALDSRSELLVRQALQRLMENRTVLVIAHRLETVLMAERVFLLNEGKLQELTRSSLSTGREDTFLTQGLVV